MENGSARAQCEDWLTVSSGARAMMPGVGWRSEGLGEM